MRLINVHSLSFEEFFEDDKVPTYAILSHRWETEEILYADMQLGTAASKVGFLKVQASCRQAQRDRLDYIWIDTCCIDKSSSAELSEAINSMYNWYASAETCYAYLSDVSVRSTQGLQQMIADVMSSQWFTRAWALQELIAPGSLKFYNVDFDFLFTKEACCSDIQLKTGIPEDVLTRKLMPNQCKVHEIMKWASDRKATRTEDIAYSLMGLFDVNFPLLYGEGTKSFIRLQSTFKPTA